MDVHGSEALTSCRRELRLAWGWKMEAGVEALSQTSAPSMQNRYTIATFPAPALASCLGIASLGRLLFASSISLGGMSESAGQVVRQVSCIMALPGLLAYCIKAALHPAVVRAEACDCMNGPALAAGMMAWGIVGAEASASVQRTLGQIIWTAAVVCHLALFACFVYCYPQDSQLAGPGRDPKWPKVHPGWFVPTVGIAAMSLNAVGLGTFAESVSLAIWWHATAWFLLLLPFITWRLIAKPPSPSPALGTVGVYMAPGSLCYVAWVSVAKTSVGSGDSSGGDGFGTFLLVMAACTWLGFVMYVPRILRVWWQDGINPSYASLTFPSVVTALAAVTAYQRDVVGTAMEVPMKVLCWVLVAVAVLVCVRVYVWFVFGICSGRMILESATVSKADIMSPSKLPKADDPEAEQHLNAQQQQQL